MTVNIWFDMLFLMLKEKSKTTIDDLANMVAKGFESIENRFESIDNRFESIENRMTTKDDIEEVNKKIDKLDSEVNNKLSRLDSSVEEIRDMLSVNDEEITNLQKRVGILEKTSLKY